MVSNRGQQSILKGCDVIVGSLLDFSVANGNRQDEIVFTSR